MFEGLTEKARRVVLFAELAARGSGETEVGLKHLLLALTHIEPELWRTIAGRPADGISLTLKARFHRGTVTGTPLSPTTKIALGDDLKKALRLAIVEAKRMHSGVIGTDHLFLGLLKTDTEGWPFETLRRHGVTYQAARDRILDEIANPRGEEPPGVFHRYSNKARRVIFFARVEAGAGGAELIRPEHLLMALVREDRETWRKVAGPDFDAGLAVQMRTAVGEGKPVLVDLPFSDQAQAALNSAELEAESAKSIETSHMLLGLLKNATDHPVFEILKQHGITYGITRARLFEETGGAAGA